MNTKEKSAEDLEEFWQAQFEMPISDTEFLTRSSNTDILANEVFTETRGDGWLKIIKGLFLFLPGAFLLFNVSSG